MYLEKVQSYKYLGSTVNSHNSIKEEIQHRITLGNKAYYANQFFFKSRLVSKKSKLKLYWSIIRPIIKMVFERKVLRKIFGPYKRKRWYMENQNKQELDELIRHKNIINHIKHED